MSSRIDAADRVLQILSLFDSKAPELKVGRIAEKLGVHKSTASRLVATLVELEFLKRHDRILRPGPELGRLGLLALNNRLLLRLAQRSMDWLSAKTGETVHLAVLEGDYAMNIAQVAGPSIIALTNFLGRKTRLHCAASGKVLLAFSDQARIGERLKPCTDRTILSITKLQAELKQVRKRGWASNLGELEIGLHAIAAPVFDASKRCVAAISIDGPSYRIPEERIPELAELCKTATRAIGFHLGAD
jgi:DNA-binding IclR family transcriptional regulator